ncbi:uncharacterized protein LOC108734234 isoform X2 [Agrilus planipennis]|nr:uncharacterized protein LOC108734234 isoform X2 [Agrilus planipennis]
MGNSAFDSYEESKIWKIKNRNKLISICDSTTNVSRKPLVCPHSPCGKIIAQSSFDIHFKYEHGDIPRFDLDRGKELHLIHDISVTTHGSSFCLGLITIYESGTMTKSCVKPHISLANAGRKMLQKTQSCTFWLMVSASTEERRNRSYVMYWMLSNNDDRYHCTLELSSQDENTVCSCFCSTTGMHESLDMDDIAQKMKCLYLTYGSLSNLLGEGPKLNFRITVH